MNDPTVFINPSVTLPRKRWVFKTIKKIGRDYYGTQFEYEQQDRIAVGVNEPCHLVSSVVSGTKVTPNFMDFRTDDQRSLHAPALDIDFPATLVPSSTKGHFHLYLDKPMDWRTYKKLLKALMKAGIIEPGFYKSAKVRKATYLRAPGVTKADI